MFMEGLGQVERFSSPTLSYPILVVLIIIIIGDVYVHPDQKGGATS